MIAQLKSQTMFRLDEFQENFDWSIASLEHFEILRSSNNFWSQSCIRKFSMFTHNFRLYIITFEIYEVECIESEFQILLTYKRFQVILRDSLLK